MGQNFHRHQNKDERISMGQFRIELIVFHVSGAYQLPIYYEPDPSSSGGGIFDRPQMIINGRRYGAPGTGASRPTDGDQSGDPLLDRGEATTGSEDEAASAGGAGGVLSSLLRTHPEASAIVKSAEKYIPFLLIILAKCFFDHATG